MEKKTKDTNIFVEPIHNKPTDVDPRGLDDNDSATSATLIGTEDTDITDT